MNDIQGSIRRKIIPIPLYNAFNNDNAMIIRCKCKLVRVHPERKRTINIYIFINAYYELLEETPFT